MDDGRWTTIADIHLATGGIDWAVGRVHFEFSPSISVNKPRCILIPEGNVTYTHSIWTLLHSDSCSDGRRRTHLEASGPSLG